MTKPVIFSAINYHAESCGIPPCSVDPLPDGIAFRSYFENEHGEQWIFIYNSQTDRLSLFGGDCGWENEMTISSLEESLRSLPGEMADKIFDKANSTGMLKTEIVTGDRGPVSLGEAEQMWVRACMRVVESRRRLRKHSST